MLAALRRIHRHACTRRRGLGEDPDQNLNGAVPVNLSRIVEAGDSFSGASVESIAEDAVAFGSCVRPRL